MRLTVEQIIDFQTNGFIIVERAFDEGELAPLISEINEFIDQRALKLKEEGKINDLCAEEPFERRLAKLHEQCPEISRGFDIMQLRGKEMFRFLKNEKLLDIAECLLGSELSCNPIQHLRAKLPPISQDEQVKFAASVPWHQDAGVTLEESDASEIFTFWIPLVDALAETGCMEVMPRAFTRGYLQHQKEGGTSIVDEQMPEIEPVVAACPKGSIVIMNKYTPHRGTTNTSDIIRWSMDLRYHKTGAHSGRPFHPEFIVRSRQNPERVSVDYDQWCSMWGEALGNSKGKRMHRV